MPPTRPKPQLTHAIVDLLAGEKRPLHVAEIGSRLEVEDRNAVSQAVDELVFDGVLLARPGRRYRLAPTARSRTRELEGAFSANPRGFGFVKAGAQGDDIFIPADCMGGAMHGDIVRARIVAQSARGPEGEVVEVIERRRKRVVGVLMGKPGRRRLEPDDARIRGPIEIVESEGDAAGAAERVAAVVEIERFPEDARELPRARLLAVLGQPGDPDVEVQKVLVAHDIAEEHPPDAVAQARAYGSAPGEAELARRHDLMSIPFVTIDPHDARDHDDAVWVERDAHGAYQAWIAIADVSHYVTTGSPLDASALERGCSVYLPDRAVPMLPPELSSHLCSLVEGQPRLCLCVHAHLDPTGAVKRAEVYEGKMRSRAFLTYEAVARALGFTTEPARDPRAEAMREDLAVMWDLSSELRKRRMRRGALDLDVPETHVSVDPETRAPVAVEQRGHDPGVKKAYRLIEELMLLGNEIVARLMIRRSIPTIFRVHGRPDPEKLERFATAAGALGVEVDPEAAADPKMLSRFVQKLESHPHKGVVHGLLLRAMQQAAYDTVNIGHFGLASSAYLHFTSPIRRYPDLVVHRQLRTSLHLPGAPAFQQDPEESAPAGEALRLAAARASELERNAMEAEREIADVYRTLYMQQHVGERFTGVVTAVTPMGVWLRIETPFVDVLIPADRLGDDDYQVDDAGVRAIGRRSGDTITLGDEVPLEIEDTSLARRVVLARRIATAARRPRSRRSDRKQPREQRRRKTKTKTKTKTARGARKKTRSRRS